MKNVISLRVGNLFFIVPALLCILFISCAKDTTCPVPRSGIVWFDNIPVSEKMIPLDRAHTVMGVIFNSLKNNRQTFQNIPSLSSKSNPTALFITAGNGRERSKVAFGSGISLMSALRDAYGNLLKVINGRYDTKHLRLDIVKKVYPPCRINKDGTVMCEKYRRSLHGIAFDREIMGALLPDEVTAMNMIDGKGRAEVELMALYLARSRESGPAGSALLESWKNKKDKLYFHPFSTESFFSEGKSTLRLYRGSRINKYSPKAYIYHSLQEAAEYLKGSVNKDGSFVYRYSPKHGRVLPGYNMLRHCGTIYAMLDLYRLTGDRSLVKALSGPVTYVKKFMRPFQGRDDALCIAGGKYVKLGGAALAIIAFRDYQVLTGKKYLNEMRKLGRYIILEQKNDGSFIHRRDYPSFNDTGFVSLYYSGEAILALTLLYGIDKNREWLDAAEKGARYIIGVRDKGKSIQKLPHDHWFIIALEELCRYNSRKIYISHAITLSRAIINKQMKNPPYPDWTGAYYSPPGAAPSAARAEGLASAYRILCLYGKEFLEPAKGKIIHEKLAVAVSLTNNFLLNCQFREENSLFIPDPRRALGGFRMGLDNYTIQVDTVQHSVSALAAFYRLLNREHDCSLKEFRKKSEAFLEKQWPYGVVYP